MEDATDPLLKSYDASVTAGKKFIQDRWGGLSNQTKRWLIESGGYSETGRATSNREWMSDAESLEYDVGSLSRCARATLPSRRDTGWQIEGHIVSDEVLSTAASMMYGFRKYEPQFLRIALEAVRINQIAMLLVRLPPEQKLPSVWGGIFKLFIWLLMMAALLVSPAILGSALASAAKGDTESATLSLYGLGLVWMLVGWAKNLAKEEVRPPDEASYYQWSQLGYLHNGPWLALGSGAREVFKEMRRAGTTVPPVAFDLCEMLVTVQTRELVQVTEHADHVATSG